MNIWNQNSLFEHPNSINYNGCPYILPGEQFTQMDDFFITLKEFHIICIQTNYQPQIYAHIQIYQQYEQILLKELKFPNGVCLHKQYFIIRQQSNQQMEIRLLPFRNCFCQRKISQEQIWHKLKKLSKALFSQFQQSDNTIIKEFLVNLTSSIKQQEQSLEFFTTITNYDFKSIVTQRIIIFTTDLDQFDKTGLSIIFRLLTLGGNLEQGQILEIINKYKAIRDKFKLFYSQYLNHITTTIKEQFNLKNQQDYLDDQFQYRFQQETISITQNMIKSQPNQEELDQIIKNSIKAQSKQNTVRFIESFLQNLSKQMEQ